MLQKLEKFERLERLRRISCYRMTERLREGYTKMRDLRD